MLGRGNRSKEEAKMHADHPRATDRHTVMGKGKNELILVTGGLRMGTHGIEG